MKVLVMGGSRFAGLATVLELQARGHQVCTFNRGRTAGTNPPGVQHLTGDRDVPADLAQLAHLELDAVVDFSAYTEAQTTKLLAHLPPVARIVHCSTGAGGCSTSALRTRRTRSPRPWSWRSRSRSRRTTSRHPGSSRRWAFSRSAPA